MFWNQLYVPSKISDNNDAWEDGRVLCWAVKGRMLRLLWNFTIPQAWQASRNWWAHLREQVFKDSRVLCFTLLNIDLNKVNKFIQNHSQKQQFMHWNLILYFKSKNVYALDFDVRLLRSILGLLRSYSPSVAEPF